MAIIESAMVFTTDKSTNKSLMYLVTSVNTKKPITIKFCSKTLELLSVKKRTPVLILIAVGRLKRNQYGQWFLV